MQQADDVSSYAREECPRIHGVRSLMNYSTLRAPLSASHNYNTFFTVMKKIYNTNAAQKNKLMKSTKVQNPRCIPRIKPIMRAYWLPIAVQPIPGQYSLLRRLAASCIVWDKAEPAI